MRGVAEVDRKVTFSSVLLESSDPFPPAELDVMDLNLILGFVIRASVNPWVPMSRTDSAQSLLSLSKHDFGRRSL